MKKPNNAGCFLYGTPYYCPCRDSDPVMCTLLQYPEYRGDREKVMENDDECKCPCHDFDEDEEEWSE